MVAVLVFLPVFARTQKADAPERKGISASEVGEVVAWMSEQEGEEEDLEVLAEHLSEVFENPLNLNSVQYEDLKMLNLLNEQQIFNLLSYRINYKRFYSIYELQAISGFDPATICRMLPFVQIGSPKNQVKTSVGSTLRFGKHKLLFRIGRILEPRKGYQSGFDSSGSVQSSRYVGSPERILLRYRFQYRQKIRAGVTAEKDPGEMLILGRQDPQLQKHLQHVGIEGFDSYSFYAAYRSIRFLRTFIAGDYHVYAGQGLTLGGSGSFGRPLDYSGKKPSMSGIRPHSGSDENRYFRGIAAELKVHRVRFLVFLSHNLLDASLPDSLNDSSGVTLDYSGYHRTIRERAKKNSIQASVAGAHLCLEKESFRIGISAVGTRYHNRVKGGSGLQANLRPAFFIQEQLGLDYRMVSGKFHFFGEGVLSGEGSLAMIHGVTAALHPRVNLTLLYRNYPVSYQNAYSNGYSRRDSYNEKGFSMQFVLLPYRKLTIRGLFDYSVHPWLRYRVDRPSQGRDMTVLAEYQMNTQTLLSGRVRHNRIQQNANGSSFLAKVGDIQKTAYRLQVRTMVSEFWMFKSRVECMQRWSENGQKTAGFLANTGFRWNSRSNFLVIHFDYSMFDTQSYEERIYAYEPDVLYSFTSSVFYDRGMKWSGLIRCRFVDPLSVWLKISRIWFRDLESLGSGPETIDGNKKTEVKVQFLFKLK
jgi:hypothetical protein